MPNLVGIGNSQVPTNAMLGGLAYQDSVGEIVIDKIKARTSDTAVDIFVYDTRKDSDGGAWRHRTQNTSWYSEGVSATRGARKEFPAVAVIVAEGTAITIYDGDDPNLPLWMQFISGSGQDIIFNRPQYWTNSAVFALNGIVCAANVTGSAESTLVLNYVSDSVRLYPISGYPTYGGDFTLGIAGRSNSLGLYKPISQVIVGDKANDVAMTVLPNAPIDASTGLPTPTIAVATGHGLSIIKDNGNVVDITGTHGGAYNDAQFVNFDSKTNAIISGFDYGAGNSNAIYKLNILPIPSTDFVVPGTYGGYQNHSSRIQTGGNDTIPKLQGNYIRDTISAGGDGRYAIRTGDSLSTGYPGALNIIQEEPGTDGSNTTYASNSRIVYITKDYNTGWMHGDIKGAFLSDTDDTNLSGTSLIANGDFSSSSTAAFTTVSGGTAAVVGGLLKLTDTEGAFCYASAPFTTVVGNQYFITADIVNSSNTANANYIRCGNDHNGIDFHNTNYGTGYGTKTFYFTATATTTYLTLISGNGVGEIGHWDNVFAYKLDNDRSVNNKGLQPYGTITKTAVATGADLVAYSGFTSTNHLEQNDNHLFGAGDFSFIFWVNLTAAGNNNQTFIDMSSSDGGVGDPRMRIHQMSSPSGSVRLYTNTGNIVSTSNRINAGWTCVAALRRSSNLELYINGELEASGSTSTSDFNTAAGQLSIGLDGDDTDPLDNGSITLVRSSASAPSAEQIKKIYDDEKKLFNENAKCTLYGTSDAVTGLAFDDTNDVLHVGTSSGSSEFQGLNRINNTTTAVTTAISASDGLIAEQ